MGLAYYIQNITEPLQKTVGPEEMLKKENEKPHKHTMRRMRFQED